jgi:hypothetical protein
MTDDTNLLKRTIHLDAWLKNERRMEEWMFKFGEGSGELWREIIMLQNNKGTLQDGLGYSIVGYGQSSDYTQILRYLGLCFSTHRISSL